MGELVSIAERIDGASVQVVMALVIMFLIGMLKAVWSAWRADLAEHRKDMRRHTEVLEAFTAAFNRANNR